MPATILLPISLAVLPIVQIPQPTRDCRLDVLNVDVLEERILVDLEGRLRAYVGLHRRVVRSIHAPTIDEEGGVLGDELRAVLVAARPLAVQGDFFTASVAELFKARVDRALLRDVATIPVRLYHPLPGERAPAVNDEFPFVGVSVEWPALFMELPRLPRELGYALWGRDLVLVDVAANLVLDVLPEALPEGAQPGTQYQ